MQFEPNHLAKLGGLTFYHLILMHLIGQRDFSTLWYFTVELFPKWSIKQVKGTFLSFDLLQLSCLLSGLPNRSRALFFLLTLLWFNSKRSTKHIKKDYFIFHHFYVLTCYAKHQTSLEKLFYLLTFLLFSYSLCKIPNRLRETLLLLTLLQLDFLHSASSWIVIIKIDWLHHWPWLRFDLYTL